MRKRLLCGTLTLIAMSLTASAQAQCPLEARMDRMEVRLDALTNAFETLVDRLTAGQQTGAMAALSVPKPRPTPAGGDDDTSRQISNLQRRVAGLIEIARRQKAPSVGTLSLRHRDQLAGLESQVDLLETLLTGDGSRQGSRLKSLGLVCRDRAACCSQGSCVCTGTSCTCTKGRDTCTNCQNEAVNNCPQACN